MSHESPIIEKILSLHQHIIQLKNEIKDDQLSKKIDDFMLGLTTVGMLDGIKINGKNGRYFLIDGKSWCQTSQKINLEVIPNFIIWEESDFFSFLDSLLKPVGYPKNKELVKS